MSYLPTGQSRDLTSTYVQPSSYVYGTWHDCFTLNPYYY